MDELGNRMKSYEEISKTKLISRDPVIIRIDGKAFHTFTRGCDKPFDKELQKCMIETTKELCANIQNCVLGYTQSDEITLVMIDDAKLNTSDWFDNQVQKMASVSASIATRAFNKAVYETVELLEDEAKKQYWKNKMFKAEFDARCFNVPDKTEAYNCLVWRQQDAIKNSITMLALAHFSHKDIQGKSGKDKITMLEAKNIRWNELDATSKQGTIIKKETYLKGEVVRTKWEADVDTPVFTQNPDYIMNLLNKNKEE